jgi:hypothetical protein
MIPEIAINANAPERRKMGCSGVIIAQTRKMPLIMAEKTD